MTQLVFVFTESESSVENRTGTRPFIYAFCESQIKEIRTQRNS
jgi:hypothetical protein